MANLESYYEEKENDYAKIKELHELHERVIELNDTTMMLKLGYYYEKIENDYDKMKE
jgi:hypothetical protein